MGLVSKHIIDVDKSIVVLPFKNMSGDDSYDYFSDGITEEIINALSKVEGLKVTARTSSFAFKNKPKDIRIIGNELGVTNAVEGSIRIAKDRIRISTQLTRTDNGFLLWSEKFDRQLDDVFALQDEISLLIADKIRENFGHLTVQDQLVHQETESIEAYENYLKGRFYFFKWDLPSMEKAIPFFAKSIHIDPNFTKAYFNLGMCYSLLGSWGFFSKNEAFEKAEMYFALGAQVGNESYETFYVRATHEFWGKWNHKKGYDYLQKAMKLNSRNAFTLDFIAEIHRATGSFEKGLKSNNQALQLDPLSVNALYTRSTILYLKGDFIEAISYVEKGLNLDPHFSLLQNLNVLILIQLNKKAQLDIYLKENVQSQTLKTIAQCFYNLFHKQEINTSKIEDLIGELESLTEPLLYPWDVYLNLYAGKTDKALSLLEEKVNNRMGQVISYKNDPLFKLLSSAISTKENLNSNFLLVDLESIQENVDNDPKNSILDDSEINALLDVLNSKMENEQLYTNQNLSLRGLAKHLDLHPNKLSWLLNECIGKNFNDYINTYRLKAFKDNALKPENKHLTLLGLAYDSGFNSKTVFNTYFKKVEGLTPKQWLKLQP